MQIIEKYFFNNTKTEDIRQESNTPFGKYFISNFLKDFMTNKSIKIRHEEKTEVQKRFERYLIDNKVLINDYCRIVSDPKYFQVFSSVRINSTKIDCLYSSYDLSYKSNSSIFYAGDIPPKSTDKQFRNIYNYLFVDTDRRCFMGMCNGGVYYFCVDCGIYICRRCVDTNLKWIFMNSVDYGYVICKNCSKYNILYRLPAKYDI